MFLMIASVSAANQTDVEDLQETSLDDDELLSQSDSDDESILSNSTDTGSDANQTQIKTTIKSDDTNIVKGSDFTVQLTDLNSTPIANKTVQFTVNSKSSNVTTDENGTAKLNINLNAGTYTVKYSFSDEGYEGCSNSTKIFVITTSTSKISASNYVAYVGLTNKFIVTLTVGGVPLAGRVVVFKFNGKTYTKKTNSKGQAKLSITKKAKGKYYIYYSFAGEDNIKSASGKAKITIKKGIATKIKKANSVIYRHKTKAYLKVKVYDARGNLLKSKKVTFKVNGKKYTKKTSSKGIAKVKIKLKKGTYKIKVVSTKTSVYKKSTKTIKIKVKPKYTRNNGMWIKSTDMKGVNFTKLKMISTKHVFLNAKAIERYGKTYVESWIKTAKSNGIKVHLWMQVFYDSADGWINPIKKGKINYNLINSKVKEAKKLAKVKGVAGIHFDYLRFPGNAYKYKYGVKAINLFTKKATNAVHKVNKKLVVSAAVMPEPNSMKKYYGQDISTMGKYLDVIVPMVYKGNYNAGTTWIKWVTKTLDKKSSKAKIWTGLQTYKSDSSLKKLSASELMNDAYYASLGGARGVILFRYGLLNYINFAEV